jgi:hypothetical protein
MAAGLLGAWSAIALGALLDLPTGGFGCIAVLLAGAGYFAWTIVLLTTRGALRDDVEMWQHP